MFWLDEGTGLLPWGLLACALHELGHLSAAAALGGRMEGLSLTAVGAELRIGYNAPLTYLQDSLVALAGPAANLLAGGMLLISGSQLAAALTLAVGGFNLLPILPLDGGRVVSLPLSAHSCLMSHRATVQPLWANALAMPWPIVPAPIIPTLLMMISS